MLVFIYWFSFSGSSERNSPEEIRRRRIGKFNEIVYIYVIGDVQLEVVPGPSRPEDKVRIHLFQREAEIPQRNINNHLTNTEDKSEHKETSNHLAGTDGTQ